MTETREAERRRGVGIIFLGAALGKAAAFFSVAAVRLPILVVAAIIVGYGAVRFVRALRGRDARAERREAIIGAVGAVVAIALLSGLLLLVLPR